MYNSHLQERRWGVIFALAVMCLMALPLIAQMPQGAVRLHVIANSDGPADQSIKLSVRDAVLKAMEPELSGVADKAQARKLLMRNGEAIQRAAQDALNRRSAGYSAHLYYGAAAFPDRLYGSRFYPAGEYETLRVVLGEGGGKNWWCVMFPPLCLVDFEQAETPQPGEGEKVVFESAVAKLFAPAGE